jgi:hypothetical protein
MSKIQDFLETKGHIIMTVFIIIQAVISVLFACLLLIATDDPAEYEIFKCGAQFLFLGFMVHFAYHSVRPF